MNVLSFRPGALRDRRLWGAVAIARAVLIVAAWWLRPMHMPSSTRRSSSTAASEADGE